MSDQPGPIHALVRRPGEEPVFAEVFTGEEREPSSGKQEERRRPRLTAGEAYLANQTDASRRTMEGSLRLLLALLVPDPDLRPSPRAYRWHELRRDDTLALRAVLQHLVDLRSKAEAYREPDGLHDYPGADRLLRGAAHLARYRLAPPPAEQDGKPGAESAQQPEPPLARKKLGISSSTANKAIYALRGVLKQAWLLELMPDGAYARAVEISAVKLKKARKRKGRALTEAEYLALIDEAQHPKHDAEGEPLAADDPRRGVTTEKGLRDALIISLGYGAGLRRDEIAGLLIEDLDMDPLDGSVALQVRGKGDKDRRVPLNTGVETVLNRYLRVRRRLHDEACSNNGVYAPFEGPLLLRSLRNGRLFLPAPGKRLRPLTGQAIYDVLKARGAASGTQDFAPHDLRRTFITNALRETQQIEQVRKLAGHASTDTTAKYDRSGDEALKQAVRKLSTPYRK